MSRRAGEAGFTLIELMISLALFGLIALAGVALVDSVLGIRARTDGRLERLGDMQRAMFVLTNDIEQVARGPVVGTSETLSFSRHMASVTGLPVPVHYALAGGTLGRSLGTGGTQRLLTHVSGVHWRYYKPGQGWLDRWPPGQDQAQAWPAAISVDIMLDGGPGSSGLLRRVVALPSRP
ncbi:prepilin-type cleavage/methylation domain-containing protein [Sphingomonas oleivorans]|uniref:Type II secretion system protein J n=1 Tax=Sphingomonas oleivorans TaxID=1735121 RepID=A0A2T5FVR0_9SPHN|nr:type II secretion system protein GspJ [Sphingomonas oleivorans]PTQ09857.1 prepilin-type cleavage/methylation domain-containing protein [Sphingomonas oleivorans]